MNCLIIFFFYSYRIYTIITQICTHIFLPGEYGAAVILSLVDLSLDYWDSGDLSMRFFYGPNFPQTTYSYISFNG